MHHVKFHIISSVCSICRVFPWSGSVLELEWEGGDAKVIVREHKSTVVQKIPLWPFSVVMSILSMSFFLPWLGQNITLFPCHELCINTWTNYKVTLCVLVHHWLSFFPYVSLLFAHRMIKIQFSTDLSSEMLVYRGQRSATEMCAGIQGFSALLKDTSVGRKCIEPSSFYIFY